MVHVACLYATHPLEASAELWEEVRRDVDEGWGKAAGEGGGVELVVEDSTVEAGVVGWAVLVESATCEHEGRGEARGREWRLVVERDDAVFHCVLKERERGEHDLKEDKETRKGKRRRGSEGIKDRAIGMWSISTIPCLERELKDFARVRPRAV